MGLAAYPKHDGHPSMQKKPSFLWKKKNAKHIINRALESESIPPELHWRSFFLSYIAMGLFFEATGVKRLDLTKITKGPCCKQARVPNCFFLTILATTRRIWGSRGTLPIPLAWKALRSHELPFSRKSPPVTMSFSMEKFGGNRSNITWSKVLKWFRFYIG